MTPGDSGCFLSIVAPRIHVRQSRRSLEKWELMESHDDTANSRISPSIRVDRPAPGGGHCTGPYLNECHAEGGACAVAIQDRGCADGRQCRAPASPLFDLASAFLGTIALCRRRRPVVADMHDRPNPNIGRRDILRGLAAGAGAAAAVSAAPLAAAAPQAADTAKRRRARYQADSPEVQTFYRVNRYPAK
jgi:hypothetical protein